MSLKLQFVPRHILRDLFERLTDHVDDPSEKVKEQVRAYSAETAFDEYCEWNGLLGWGPKLREAMRALKAAEEKK